MKKQASSFISNIYAIFIVGIIFSISLAINSIFVDIRENYLKNGIHTQIICDLVYFGILFILLLILIFLYKGSLNVSEFVLKSV